ncbi:MAG: matrixin family metalloprotease [Polyangiales bacterium]
MRARRANTAHHAYRRGAILVAGVVLTLLDQAEVAQAWCRMTTVQSTPGPSSAPCPTEGIPLAWQRRCISYAVDIQGTAGLSLNQARDLIDAAFQTWAALDCGTGSPLLQVRQLVQPSNCQEAAFCRHGANVNTVAFIDDWEARDYDPFAFAITTVFTNAKTGEIVDADMQINERLGPYADCPSVDVPNDPDPQGCPLVPGQPTPVDLRNIVTHEVGHFLGLGHTPDDVRATMYEETLAGEVRKRSLRPDDIEGYCAAYTQDTLPLVCNFAPEGGLELSCTADSPCPGAIAFPQSGCDCRLAVTAPAGPWLAALLLTLLLLTLRRCGLMAVQGDQAAEDGAGQGLEQ